ncbi:hypothetical protein AWJ20_4747 [Sugiyamaella lignohabitans]|uniref:Enoyl reductase (ER) domain-containing protein n=1 Tax=Sugiyamaella lignohabitans TaxID=796027 RepID=A0A167E9A9_9ASCO|nr:uncharacterized protein AWJ20_4747 [Sugiyamaella lignohabitans]ANB13800.1 hypothetical protein AWJ20_4747 [Sugiyamaella lignohabitans]
MSLQIKELVLENPPVTETNLVLGQETSTFKEVTSTLDPESLKTGDIVVQPLIFSNDPTQRAWIQKGLDPKRMYVPPVLKGEAMRSLGAGKVIVSKSDKYKVGDIVIGLLSWSNYSLVNELRISTKVSDPNADLPTYLSLVGASGLAAYYGLTEVGRVKPEHTVVVSAASGATGIIAVQYAKHVIGCKKVIGITGSDDKIDHVKKVGADVAVNYKDPEFKKQLSDAIGPDFADVYFDNVGGEILDFMLSKVKPFGVVIACGAIAGYNDHSKGFIRNWGQIITNRLRVEGFIVTDFKDKHAETFVKLFTALQQGKISLSDSINLVDLSSESNSLAKIPEVWGQLFSGNKVGKLLTRVSKI